MTERSSRLKEHIDQQRAMGVRRSMCFALAENSLRLTVGEPEALRLYKARAYVLDHAPLPVLPEELIVGSTLGLWPVEESMNTETWTHAPMEIRVDALEIGLRGVELAASPEERMLVQSQQRFMLRYANALSGAANRASSPRREELQHMAQTLRHLSTERADTFYEGLQLFWMLLVMAWLMDEQGHGLGRLDQLLGARYESDLAEGRLEPEDGAELLRCVFLKLSEPIEGIDRSIVLGGLTPEGGDGANALTSLCLKVLGEKRMPALRVELRIGSLNPPELLAEALPMLASQARFAVWNDDFWIENRVRLRYRLTAANDYHPKELQPQQDAYCLNLPDVEQKVLKKGMAGELKLETFDQFFEAVKSELKKMVPNDDTPICAQGLFEAAHRLMAIKRGVFDSKKARLWQSDFEARLDALARETPHVGEDNDEVDSVARGLLSSYFEAVSSAQGTKQGRMAALAHECLFGEKISPTTALNSLLKLDFSRLTGSCSFSLPINVQLIQNNKGMDAVKALVWAYLKCGGPEISLEAAQPDA